MLSSAKNSLRANLNGKKDTILRFFSSHILSIAYGLSEICILNNKKDIKFKPNMEFNKVQMLSFYREYLLDSSECLKKIYKKTWTKSSIEFTWEKLYIKRKKFLPGQQQKRLYDLLSNNARFKKLTYPVKNLLTDQTTF